MAITRSPAIALLIAAAAAVSAAAQLDIGRLTMGRVVYPEDSWSIDSVSIIEAPELRDGRKDTLRSSLELEYGVTDRLSLETGLISSRADRSRLRIERGLVEARYRLIDDPLRFALFGEYLPSFQKQAAKFETGFEAIKNLGRMGIVGKLELEIEKHVSEGYEPHVHGMLGPLYRLGIHGVTGIQWHYEKNGVNSINIVIGGAVGKHAFLSVQPQVGISRRAPDFRLILELSGFIGPYALGAWELD